MAGTTALGAWLDMFVLTWPAALYTMFRVTTEVGARARQGTRRLRVLARAALLLFLVACYGYFQLCLAVGYPIAWSFLGGLAIAVLAVIVVSRARTFWMRATADGIGFTLYFWISGLIPAWKSQLT